jgi:hypothetical protein
LQSELLHLIEIAIAMQQLVAMLDAVGADDEVDRVFRGVMPCARKRR